MGPGCVSTGAGVSLLKRHSWNRVGEKQRHDGNASIKTGRETEGTAAVTDGQSLREEKTFWIRDSYLSYEWTNTAQNRASQASLKGRAQSTQEVLTGTKTQH